MAVLVDGSLGRSVGNGVCPRLGCGTVNIYAHDDGSRRWYVTTLSSGISFAHMIDNALIDPIATLVGIHGG